MSTYPGLGTKEMMAPKSSLVKKQVFGLLTGVWVKAAAAPNCPPWIGDDSQRVQDRSSLNAL